MLKTTGSSQELALRAFRTSNDKLVEGGSRVDETVVNLSKNKKSRKLTYMLNIETMGKPNFLTLNIKKALTI